MQANSILLPNSCIKEVFISADINLSPNKNYVVGNINWKGQDIPLLSLETEAINDVSATNIKKIIVVVESQNNQRDKHVCGIVARRVPQVVQANIHSIEKNLTPKIFHDLALSYITIKGKPAFIPDMQRLVNDYLVPLTNYRQ